MRVRRGVMERNGVQLSIAEQLAISYIYIISIGMTYIDMFG